MLHGLSPLDLPSLTATKACRRDVELDPNDRFLPSPCILNKSELPLPLDNDMRRACEFVLS